jgi:hypothetical protein
LRGGDMLRRWRRIKDHLGDQKREKRDDAWEDVKAERHF